MSALMYYNGVLLFLYIFQMNYLTLNHPEIALNLNLSIYYVTLLNISFQKQFIKVC